MIVAFDEFELDAERTELRRAGVPIKVDALVLRLLLALVRHAGQLVTKDELVDEVWEGRAVADNVLTVSMARLRKALGHERGEREFVVNVYGRGYRFVQPVVVRETSPAPLITTSTATRASDGPPPFVGRERVVARLHHALREARAGHGRLCVLSGEAGIGKTGAVEAFERSLADAGVQIAWGYCREAGDTPPLHPWLRLLRAVIPAAELGELERHFAVHQPEAVPGYERHQGFDAVLRALAVSAARAPCVLVLDDLHRADAASIELLAVLLDEIARMPILVIATLRHATGRLAPRRETQLPHVLGHRNCERIGLERLRADDVMAYVRALLDDADGSLGRAVFEKSEGNPFFMAELSRSLRDAAQPDPSALSVPASALELIRQRVAQLDPRTRSLLSAAAVIGRTFELPLLSAVTGIDPAALISDLDAALAAEVAVAAPDSMTAFAFGHELLRVVLRDELSAADQRRLHLRIGEALEQRQHAGEPVPASELAYHFHAGLPDTSPRKTVDHCRAAAAAAAAMFANADFVRYTRHALEALDLVQAPSVRLRMLLLNQIAIYARGYAPREAARAMRHLIQLGRAHDDAPAVVRAAYMLNLHPGFRAHRDVAPALEQALGRLDRDPSRAGTTDGAETRALALATLAYTTPNDFSRERSSALIAEAERLARASAEPTALRAVLAAKLYVEGGPEHEQGRVAVEAELERLAQENPTRMRVLPVELSMHRALWSLQHGDAAAMNAALERAVLRSGELRHLELSWHSRRFHALARVNAGAWSEGVAALEVLHRRAEQHAIFGTEPLCAFDRVVVFGELSDTLVLDDAVRSALEYDAGDSPAMWSLIVRALASAGLADEGRAALRALTPAALSQLPCDANYLGTLGHLARGALTLGALDHAEALYALLTPHPAAFAGHISFLCEGSVSQLLGMLAQRLGRHAEAIAHFEIGIAANDRFVLQPRAAEARLQLARCLIERGMAGDAARARALASDAEASAARLGWARLARNAAALR